MVELLENILALFLKQDLMHSHQPLAEEWFFCFFNQKRKVFAAEENSCLHKRELLKYLKNFQILVFQWSLSIEIAL